MRIAKSPPAAGLAALLAVLTLAAPARAGDLEEAKALRDAGKWDDALARYEKASAADPKSADAALGVAEALCALGKYEKAAKSVNPALEANPDHVGLLVAKARAYMLIAAQLDREGGDPQAIMGYCGDGDKWVKKALEKDPKHADARVLKAKVLQYQGGGSTPEAIALLEEVARDVPACFDAHWELGTAAMNAARADNSNKAKWAKAEKHFREAFQADGKSGQALLQATYCKQWQGQAGANVLVGDYEQCARLMPQDDAALLQVFKMRRQAADDARAALRRLAEKDGSAKAKALLLAAEGEAALAAQKPDAAAAAMEKSIAAWGPSDPKDLYWVCTGAARAPGLDGGDREKLWNALAKQWPDRPDAANDAGLWYREAKQYEKSAAWYDRAAATEAAQRSPQILNDTGLIYHYHLGKNDVAEKWFRKAIAAGEEQGVDPYGAAKNIESMGYRDALNNLAKLLREEKRWKDLGEFVESHVPEGWPFREQWKSAAESGGK